METAVGERTKIGVAKVFLIAIGKYKECLASTKGRK